MKVILASASPRRKQLLSGLVDEFEVLPSNEDENEVCNTPEETAKNLSFAKAKSVFKNHGDCLVIGADTIVVNNGEILGKPKDEKQAFEMLSSLSGKTHEVITGVTVMTQNKTETFADVSLVTFFNLEDKQILDYISTGSPMDKAGAYGIQDSGFVCEISGSFDNVVGLPTERLKRVLGDFLGGNNG